jgi:plasmid stabilization system protein ParE
MAHRVSPQAERDLDDIWYYVAKESGSIEIANRLIDSITHRFFLLASSRTWGVPAMKTSALGAAVSPWANT